MQTAIWHYILRVMKVPARGGNIGSKMPKKESAFIPKMTLPKVFKCFKNERF